MTKTSKLTIVSLFFALIFPLGALAFTIKSGQSVYIPKEMEVDGNLYAAGNSVTVEGRVTGDVICAAQSVIINGEVTGDVICAAQTININGKISGNLRAAANSINFNGQVARNLTIAAANLNTTASSTVGWDILLGVANADIKGRVGRDLVGAVSTAKLGGEVGKNVHLIMENERTGRPGLIITDKAKIGSNLTYRDKKEAEISSLAEIIGEVKHNLPKTKERPSRPLAWLYARIYSIFSALIVGLVIIALWGEEIKKLTDKMLDKIGPTIGWGAIIMFLTPIIAFFLLITLIGIPLALIVIALWLIALWLSKLLVGILVGRSLLEKLWREKKENLFWAMTIGVIVSWIIFSLPLAGWLLSLAAIWWGLGGLYLYLVRNKVK